MTDSNQEIQKEKQQIPIKKKRTFLPIAFLYFLGFYITQKSGYDSTTSIGIAMLIFGWLCMLLSMLLSVSMLFRLFKEHSKRNN